MMNPTEAMAKATEWQRESSDRAKDQESTAVVRMANAVSPSQPISRAARLLNEVAQHRANGVSHADWGTLLAGTKEVEQHAGKAGIAAALAATQMAAHAAVNRALTELSHEDTPAAAAARGHLQAAQDLLSALARLQHGDV